MPPSMRIVYHLFVVLVLLLALGGNTSFAQKKRTHPAKPSTKAVSATSVNKYEAIDKQIQSMPADSASSLFVLASYIKAHWSEEEERIRAVYWWLAQFIQYDIANLYSIEQPSSPDQIIKDVFTTHKAICSGYAITFKALCDQIGIKNYEVTGYTKHGYTIESLPHAWNAARIGGEWYLFDPTWGAGSIKDNQFVFEPNDVFFMVAPAEFIPTHIPFDPLWQFLEHPVTHHAFTTGNALRDSSQAYFNFKDSIAVYETLSPTDQLQATLRRVQQKGDRNVPLFTYLKILSHNLRASQLDAVMERYTRTVQQINAFIDYRNRLFVPERPEPEIRATLDSIALSLERVKFELGKLAKDDDNIRRNMSQVQLSISDADKWLINQEAFVKKYYSTKRLFRKMLFSRQ